jgi:hypothetical protein
MERGAWRELLGEELLRACHWSLVELEKGVRGEGL